MIRHMVMVRFADTASDSERQALMQGLRDLQTKLAGFVRFDVIKNISPETPVVHGFKDGFICDFLDQTARDAYLDDPDHRALGRRLVALCDGVENIQVVDYLVPQE